MIPGSYIVVFLGSVLAIPAASWAFRSAFGIERSNRLLGLYAFLDGATLLVSLSIDRSMHVTIAMTGIGLGLGWLVIHDVIWLRALAHAERNR